MLGQALVDERVIGPQQVEHAAIFVHDALNKEFCLASKGLPQVVIEVRKGARIRIERCQIAQVQPLSGEVAHQHARPSVCQHPPYLLIEHGRLLEPSARGQVAQFIVGDAAPKEE